MSTYPSLFRQRDILILFVIAIAIYITFDSIGYQYLFSNSWYKSDRNYTAANVWRGNHLKPIIADLDGDGFNEIILITRDFNLQVLKGIAEKIAANPNDIFQPDVKLSKKLMDVKIQQVVINTVLCMLISSYTCNVIG